ncbi:hypothetical protein ACQCVE_05635 [Metabacillus sp. 113a]|uniref:hypothetical protein n=1 Tax=Metabacillus sp. 113a TaxID=3404706 RepID=UPI003CF71130
MTASAISAPRWGWMLLMAFLILGSNTLIYRLPGFPAGNPEVVIGSLLDCILILPLAAYLLIIRKRYSSSSIIPVIMAGLAAAWLIIPMEYMGLYPYLPYFVIGGEAIFMLFFLTRLVRELPGFIRNVQASSADSFTYRLDLALQGSKNPSRIADVLASEALLFYYSLFSWKRKPAAASNTFTFHKKTSAIAFNVMIIHAIAIESIAFHVLFHSFSPSLSIVMLLLNIYTILFLLGEIQAVRLEPFILTEDALCLQLGLKKRLYASYSEIQSVSYYEKEAHGNDKNVFDGILADFVKEDPAIVIEFIKPVKVRKMYGFTDKAASAHIRPDNPEEFYKALKKKLLKE